MLRVALYILSAFILFTVCNTGNVSADPLDRYVFYDPEQHSVDENQASEVPKAESPDIDDLKPPGFGAYMKDTAIYYGASWAVRLYYVRDKNVKIFDSSFSKWWDNITDGPVWEDGDAWFTNWVLHPFFGMVSYQYYRARGHSFWASALGSAIQSTLFEYAIEGPAIRPSAQDLISTPLVGVPLGYGFEKLSDWLIEQDNQLAVFAAYLANTSRIYTKDRKFGLINPVSGSFEFQGPFTISPSKGKGIDLAYPLFFEPAMPLGRIGIQFEIQVLKEGLNGEFILYPIRIEFPDKSQLFSFYLRIPYGGINNVDDGDIRVRDGYELGNIVLGAKHILAKSRNFLFTGGLDLYTPTSFTDSQDRLQQVVKYRKNVPDYLYQAFSASPYLSAALWKGAFSLQGSVSSDFIFNAKNLESNDFELKLNYSSAVGVSVPIEVISPTVFFEFDGYTFPTADTFDKTDLYIAPGIRFGNKYSPGVAVQIPVHGPAKDIADYSLLFDIQMRY